MKHWIQKIEERVYLTGIIMSIILAMLCEICGRGSIEEGLMFAIEKKFVFGINVFIIFLTWSFAVFFKRRFFYYLIVTTIWGAIGITNGVILGYRNTPFTFVDIQLAKAGLDIMNNYMSSFKIIFTFLMIAAIASILIWLFFKAPAYEGPRKFRKHIFVTIAIVLTFSGCYKFGLNTGRIVDRFANLNLSYKAYGVPYCFSITLIDNGIDQPLNYSPRTIKNVKKKVNKIKVTEPEKKPNIIVLQLESFFDVKHMKDLTFSENPTPYFDFLQENYTSGYFKVPTYGAGTINTEFEVLTQMNKDFFGAGEYPYKSILQETTCETMNYILKKLGYRTHALHNNRATFYDRNEIYATLGFDTFTSSEFMNVKEMTPNGWIKDKILTEEIIKLLDSTKKKDFIFAVSVQGHGEYPSDVTTMIPNPKITLEGMENKERANKLTYYVNQIYEMDLFLKELTSILSEYPEDVILAIYGDHLPSIEFNASEMDNRSTFETEYVIWSNFDMEAEKEDIQAYQLGSRIFDKIGIHNGVMTRYHQYYKEAKSKKGYITNMKLLEYDMLYGSRYIFNKKNPFTATALKMGTLPIELNEVVVSDETLTVFGENYTEYSAIYINGTRIETEFISPQEIRCQELPEYGDEIKVVQESKKHIQFAESRIYYY